MLWLNLINFRYTLNEISILNFSNGHNQKVHMHMVDLMSSIICEGDTVSQELLDTVLVNLVPAHKVSSNIFWNVSKAC